MPGLDSLIQNKVGVGFPAEIQKINKKSHKIVKKEFVFVFKYFSYYCKIVEILYLQYSQKKQELLQPLFDLKVPLKIWVVL